MCVYEGINASPACLGLIGERGNGGAQLLLQQRNAAAEVQPQIDGDLFVARAAGMQAPPRIADARHQLALDEAVHVFIVTRDPRRIGAALLENRRQAAGDRRGILRIEHAGARQGFRPGEAAGHIVFEETPVERKRDAEIKRGRIRRRVKPSRP